MRAKTAQIKIIKASSRGSVKIGESFYTLEYGEERSVPSTMSESDLDRERESLWDMVNGEVDKQVEDVLKAYKK